MLAIDGNAWFNFLARVNDVRPPLDLRPSRDDPVSAVQAAMTAKALAQQKLTSHRKLECVGCGAGFKDGGAFQCHQCWKPPLVKKATQPVAPRITSMAVLLAGFVLSFCPRGERRLQPGRQALQRRIGLLENDGGDPLWSWASVRTPALTGLHTSGPRPMKRCLDALTFTIFVSSSNGLLI